MKLNKAVQAQITEQIDSALGKRVVLMEHCLAYNFEELINLEGTADVTVHPIKGVTVYLTKGLSNRLRKEFGSRKVVLEVAVDMYNAELTITDGRSTYR